MSVPAKPSARAARALAMLVITCWVNGPRGWCDDRRASAQAPGAAQPIDVPPPPAPQAPAAPAPAVTYVAQSTPPPAYVVAVQPASAPTSDEPVYDPFSLRVHGYLQTDLDEVGIATGVDVEGWLRPGAHFALVVGLGVGVGVCGIGCGDVSIFDAQSIDMTYWTAHARLLAAFAVVPLRRVFGLDLHFGLEGSRSDQEWEVDPTGSGAIRTTEVIGRELLGVLGLTFRLARFSFRFETLFEIGSHASPEAFDSVPDVRDEFPPSPQLRVYVGAVI